jgi:uncharacterized repeat protein (TIGR03837 family)
MRTTDPKAPPGADPRIIGTRWDLFCRVVDNYGDAGICWRIARQLAAEHAIRPRIWIDAPAALEAIVPGAAPGTTVDGVRIELADLADPRLAAPAPDEVAEVVVGALAGTIPEGYRAAMRTRRPVWIHFEYLSAEDWVDAHHGLPSPKPDGLVEHFFFPGFGPATGGLLREADLLGRRAAFVSDPRARRDFLGSIGVPTVRGERLASLFCYPYAPARALLDGLALRPERWRVLVPRGVAPAVAGHPLAHPIPFLSQPDYDRLLWRCDLNMVRGEESMVRALWAQRPMLWQVYRQPDDAHAPKLDAFVARWCALAAPAPAAAAAFATLEQAWNDGSGQADTRVAAAIGGFADCLPELGAAAGRWAARASDSPDLVTRLTRFAADRL